MEEFRGFIDPIDKFVCAVTFKFLGTIRCTAWKLSVIATVPNGKQKCRDQDLIREKFLNIACGNKQIEYKVHSPLKSNK